MPFFRVFLFVCLFFSLTHYSALKLDFIQLPLSMGYQYVLDCCTNIFWMGSSFSLQHGRCLHSDKETGGKRCFPFGIFLPSAPFTRLCHGIVAQDLSFSFLIFVKLTHYIADIMLTCEDLLLL